MELTTSVPTEDRTRLSFFLSANRKLSYSIYGPESGMPFILFHGSPGSRIAMEEDLFYQLGVQMICPERPGYGNSSPNPEASFQSWAADIAEFLDHMRLGKVAIGGVSGGGPYAMAFAARHQDRMKSLSLISSAAPPDLPGYKDKMALTNKVGFLLNKYAPFLVRSISKNFAKNLKKNPERTFDRVFKQLCDADKDIIRSMKAEGTFQVLVEHLQEAFANGVEGHVADMKIFSNPWDIAYESISCMTYLWHGMEDTLAPVSGVRALAGFFPNVEAKYVPNAGHLLMEDATIFRQILEKVKGE
ncbi:MAG: alpha/beta hydrolase [Bacteroidota bacterium]